MKDYRGEHPIDIREYLAFVAFMRSKGLPPIIADEVESFIERREEAKKKGNRWEELGYKLLQVSSYAIGGISRKEKSGDAVSQYYSRFPDASYYNTVTSLAREIIHVLAKEVTKLGLIPLYGDSDSIFAEYSGSPFSLALKANEIAEVVNRYIQEGIREAYGIRRSSITVEPKAVYEYLFFPSVKKRYRGKGVWRDGKYEQWDEIVGFEAKRTDAFPLLKEVQERVQEILVSVPPEEVNRVLQGYLQEVERRVRNGECDDKLIMTVSLRKGDLDKYTTNVPQVRVARKLRERGILDIGTVQWIVVKADRKGRVEEPVIPGQPVPKPEPSGYDYYIRRVRRMVERLLGGRIDDARVVDLSED